MEIRRWGLAVSTVLWFLSTSTLPAGAVTPAILPVPHHQALTGKSKGNTSSQSQVMITNAGEFLHVRHRLSCTLTAYTSGYESTGKKPGDPGYGITASGTVATVGRTIAVDPQVISIGSKVYIEGLGIRYAEDTGAAVKGKHIDVYLGDGRALQKAIEFGVKRNVPVYILE